MSGAHAGESTGGSMLGPPASAETRFADVTVDCTIGAKTCGLRKRTQMKIAVESDAVSAIAESAIRIGEGFGFGSGVSGSEVGGTSVESRCTSGIGTEASLATLPRPPPLNAPLFRR